MRPTLQEEIPWHAASETGTSRLPHGNSRETSMTMRDALRDAPAAQRGGRYCPGDGAAPLVAFAPSALPAAFCVFCG